MQVAAGQDGIQRLLAAEKEAQQIVAQARKAKSDRLKQAKAEAEKEIKAYKQQREEAYQKLISDDTSNSGATEKRLESESKDTVKAIQKSISEKKKEVSDQLLSYVTSVSFDKHRTM
jgi:V-type H+-transporting ATPase subunit G